MRLLLLTAAGLSFFACSQSSDKKFSEGNKKYGYKSENVEAALETIQISEAEIQTVMAKPVSQFFADLSKNMTDDAFYVDGVRFQGLKSMVVDNQAMFNSLDERFGSFAEFVEHLNVNVEGKASFKQMAQFTQEVGEQSPSFPEISKRLTDSGFANSEGLFDAEAPLEYSEYVSLNLQSAEEFVAPSGCSSIKSIANLTLPGVVASALSCGKAAVVGAAESAVSVAGAVAAEGAIVEIEMVTGGAATPLAVPAAEAVAAGEGTLLASIWSQVATLCGGAVAALAISGTAGVVHDSSCQARRKGLETDKLSETQKINNCVANAKKIGARTDSCYPKF